MKILLVCAGGMSTGILMNKMKEYWKEQGQELDIMATGLAEYQDVYKDYEIIMLGPQISYRLDEVKENTGLPCEAIPSFDYAVANCPQIMKLANKLLEQR